MGRTVFYCAGTTQAARKAAQILGTKGLTFSSVPGSHITDVLLDVPSFRNDGSLRDGEEPEALFSRLSPGTRLWGGNLKPLAGFIPIDLLQDSNYLAQNAAITADCALKIAAPLLDTTWKLSRILIIGWGRIGKQLSKMLKPTGAAITVSTRKASDRALIRAFGYQSLEPQSIAFALSRFDLIFNTAPAQILGPELLDQHPRCIPIDLASVQGLYGKHVILARGLPGKLAPRASGLQIADTILQLGKEVF